MARIPLWVTAGLAAAAVAHGLVPGYAGRVLPWRDTSTVQKSGGELVRRGSNASDAEVIRDFQVASPVLTPQGPVTGNQVVGQPPRGVSSSCQQLLMEHHFANSYGQPFVGNYNPPDCSFNRVVMNFTVVSEGVQYDRLGLMYLGDNEVWRTSTAEPSAAPGIVWTYWKDMTTYLSLWKQPQTLIFDIDNIVSSVDNGIYNCTLTATFFEDQLPGPGAEPADLVLPVSRRLGAEGEASAFFFPSENASTTLTLPRNANRAVFLVSANGQIDEEFWWTNVPQNGVDAFPSAGAMAGLSSFREVRVRIDGHIAGLTWPFPVIFTGGISPPLHRPIVGLEAFDLREYEIDVTPWLGYLSDGRPHTFSMEVVGVNNTDGTRFATSPSYWILTGKVLLWLDDDAYHVTTGAQPEVFISPIDYVGGTVIQQGVSLTYRQSIHRSIEVRGAIATQRGFSEQSWTQQFYMYNDGQVTDGGNYQTVDADYSGQDKAASGPSTTFYTGFSYPVRLAYQYTAPDGSYDFSLNADLYQGLDRTVTGASVLPNGLAPFVKEMPGPLAGSSLSTYRNGSAFYYEYDDETKGGGSALMYQDYQFGAQRAMDPPAGDYAASPLLYSRQVTATNETVTADQEYTFQGFVPPPFFAPERPMAREGSFAPMPGTHRGPGLSKFFAHGQGGP